MQYALAMPALRPRQQKAVDDLRAAYRAGRNAVVLVAPTGSGKTATAAEIIRSAISRGNPVWFLAHLQEILLDTSRRLTGEGIQHGFIMAGMPSDPTAMVQVVSVQTAARRPILSKPALIIIDECHLAVAKTYLRVIEAAGNPKLLGLTATPERLDRKGLNELFDHLVHTCSTRDLIDEGLLSPLRYYAPSLPDLSNVRDRGGDYDEGDLAEVMDQPTITGDAIAAYRKYAQGRPAVAFCTNIKHATHTAEAFAAAGFRAVAISGKSTAGERKHALEALKAGQIDLVANVGLWVAGVDCPNIGCVILLRPTKSVTVYLQSIGRGLRIHQDKDDLVVLDHAGNVFEHGMPDEPREWTLEGRRKRKGQAAPPVRQCPACFAAHAPAPVCPCCGHTYFVAEREGPRIVEGELLEITSEVAQKIRKPHPAAGCKTYEDLVQRAREKGYSDGWAKHIWQARQRKQLKTA